MDVKNHNGLHLDYEKNGQDGTVCVGSRIISSTYDLRDGGIKR